MGVRSRSRVVFDILIIVLSTNSPTVEAPTTPRARAHGAHRSQFHRSRENTSPSRLWSPDRCETQPHASRASTDRERQRDARESAVECGPCDCANCPHAHHTDMCGPPSRFPSLCILRDEAGGVRVSSLRGHSPRTPGTPGSRRCAVEADSCGRAQGVFAGPRA